MSWQQDSDNAVISILSLFDQKMTWLQSKTPNQTAVIRSHLRNFGGNEADMVNAYGASGVEIIADVASFPTSPEKLDRMELDGERWTIRNVILERGFTGKPLFYRLYCQGGN